MEAADGVATPATHHALGIEGFAIEPIPDALKTVRWPDLFLLVSNFLVNPSTILIGGLAVASGLSVWATILSSTLGIVVCLCGVYRHGHGRVWTTASPDRWLAVWCLASAGPSGCRR